MSENTIFNALLFLGHQQLQDGLYMEAMETFSAAHLVDEADGRAPEARHLAAAKWEETRLLSSTRP